MGVKIARVFPQRTKYTPTDDLCFFDAPDLFAPQVDEVHVSCLFTWDKPKAERLADEWGAIYPDTKLGGPAYDDPGGEFTPGMYVREGYVQTSRGCPRRCSFCLVPCREGRIRELTIHEGPWLMDNNILGCSRKHQRAVFEMLKGTKQKIKFLGGLDTTFFKEWHYAEFIEMKKQIQFLYIAYDMPADRDSVRIAIKRLYKCGFKQNQIWCFVLVGYGGDTPEEADKRCEWVFAQGGVPFASYYRGPDEMNPHKPPEWGKLTSRWTFVPVIFSRLKREGLQHHEKFIRGRYATST